MEFLVAGGGLAGAACGIALAQAGREVVLVEREAAPAHKVCGEFLSTEVLAYLARLGLDAAALGGQRTGRLRLARAAAVIEARLPFEGLCVTRRRLDAALLAQAEAAGVTVRRGRAVRRVRVGDDLEVALDGGEVLRPQRLMLATGKHEVRGAARAAGSSDSVGFKMYFRLAPAQRAELAGHVELIMFPGGYAGLEMVEDGAANFSLAAAAGLLRRLGGKWENLLEYMQGRSAHLARRLAGAEAMLAAPLSIARVPYGFRHVPRAGEAPGMFRLGDQAAVIQSFTGDGMAIALHSAALAARFACAGRDAAAYHRRLAADVEGQIRRAGWLHGAMMMPGLGAGLFAAARAFPGVLAWSAAVTRIPARALAATG